MHWNHQESQFSQFLPYDITCVGGFIHRFRVGGITALAAAFNPPAVNPKCWNLACNSKMHWNTDHTQVFDIAISLQNSVVIQNWWVFISRNRILWIEPLVNAECWLASSSFCQFCISLFFFVAHSSRELDSEFFLRPTLSSLAPPWPLRTVRLRTVMMRGRPRVICLWVFLRNQDL